MKPDDVRLFGGCALIAILCGWAVFSLSKQLRSNIASGTVVDRTLSERSKDDIPGLLPVQVIGYLLVIAASSLIGLGAIIKFAQVVANMPSQN